VGLFDHGAEPLVLKRGNLLTSEYLVVLLLVNDLLVSSLVM